MDKKNNIFSREDSLKLIGIGIIIGIFISILGSVAIENLTAKTFKFYIEESKENLEGTLYLEKNYLGMVKEGKIKIHSKNIYPGEISLKLKNSENYIYWNLSKYDISSGKSDFKMPQYVLDDFSKKVSDYDLEFENNELISIINNERTSNGKNVLFRDDRLDSIAENITKKYMSYYLESYDYFEEDISKGIQETKMLSNWFSSLEETYELDSNTSLANKFIDSQKDKKSYEYLVSKYPTNVGISTTCNENKKCITLLIYSENQIFLEDSLRKGYLISNDPYYRLEKNDLEVDYDLPVEIIFKSDKSARIHVAKDEKDYNKIRSGRAYNKIFQKDGKEINEKITLNPGNIIVIFAKNNDINYNLTIKEVYP